MRRRLFTIFSGLSLLLCVALAGGCVQNLSNSQPFSDYVDRPLVLLRGAELWAITSFAEVPRGDGWYRRQVLVDSEYRRPERGQLIGVMPPGTQLTIQRVNGFRSWSGGPFHALGQITLPETGEAVSFEFQWGSFEYVRRAPWEPESVPGSRYVGADGRQFTATTSVPRPNAAPSAATPPNRSP